MSLLPRRTVVWVFLAFALAYFFSALLRAITATLAPELTREFALNARDLGLLAGGYFLGFSATQLPLGTWLDRSGPKRVLVSFLAVAVLGCLVFSWAQGFAGLLLGRILIGVGVSACLMAPLTGYRRWLEPPMQLRANAWMLMTGSFGMLASTLPVQWLLPSLGWRPMFWGLAALVALAMVIVVWVVPRWQTAPAVAASSASAASTASEAPVAALRGVRAWFAGYGEVWRHAYFRRMTPVGFFSYGGMIAVQTLWAGPWMVKVCGYSPQQAAAGLFGINLAMLLAFWLWGMVNPWLARRGVRAEYAIARGLPLSFLVLAMIIIAGEKAAAAAWALFCVSSTVIAMSQPAVGMAFHASVAGRALSAYNLVIFAGVFAVQWGIGLAIDGFAALGLDVVNSYRAAMAVFWLCAVGAWLHFLWCGRASAVQPQAERG